MGVVDQMYGDLLIEGAALPSLLYTPTDFSFQDVYDELIPFLESEEPGFTEEEFYQFLNDMSVDDYVMTADKLYLRLDIETMDDIFFTTTESKANFMQWMDELGTQYGEQFVYDSVWGSMVFNWEYDTDGILKNLHLQAGVGMETTGDEELSLSYEVDISQGEFDGKNGEYSGEPLIEIYDHWLYPDVSFGFILPQGTDNVINIDSDEYDIHMGIKFTATAQVRMQTQIWAGDPSTSDLFQEGTGMFFSIDSDDQSKITFPITLTVDLRPDLVALGEINGSYLESLFQIYSWDDTADDWVLEEDFDITIDMTNEQVIIEVNHLSAFAIGAKVENGTETGTGTEGNTGLFSIPGYALPFFFVAVIGTVSFVYLRKRK